MKRVLQVIVALPGVLFVVTGLRWITDPAGAADSLGMTLLGGVGRSSQIGDMTAFFLTLGSFVLIGALTRTRYWFYAPVMLLAVAAAARVLSWLLHDAALAVHLIVPELAIAALLWFASKWLCERR